jgi:fido (protein-threonine AMPylation protein)
MAHQQLPDAILEFLARRATESLGPATPAEITAQVQVPRPTVNRHLRALLTAGRIMREGTGRATTYHYNQASAVAGAAAPQTAPLTLWSPESHTLRAELTAPLASRTPVSYQRQFVDDYRPNQSSLLPTGLADSLFAQGRMPGQQPAGTYARKVLEQLLIDLSWSSSHLEGNRMSLLDTRNLFLTGRSAGDDTDSTMLLNHKDAIEFIVDAVPSYGITVPVVRNLHSLLMQGLLANPRALGAIRTTIVNIDGAVYVPTQVPSLLEEMLSLIIEKSRSIKNPIEGAFFLWVNLAYLQPFEDGNKRTSRLAANLPLLLYNCAPLSFLDVDPADYAIATLGVYERLDVSLAAELFAWTYRRSIPKYQAVLASMGTPDPLRAKYREQLIAAVQDVVQAGHTLAHAIAAAGVAPADQEYFQRLLETELAQLEAFNCARYRLTIGKTEEWIAKGRPA